MIFEKPPFHEIGGIVLRQEGPLKTHEAGHSYPREKRIFNAAFYFLLTFFPLVLFPGNLDFFFFIEQGQRGRMIVSSVFFLFSRHYFA